MDRKLFMYPNNSSVKLLDCAKAFESLTQTEKLYAHHMSQALWIGGLIAFLKNSPESPLIFLMLMRLFKAQSIPSLKTLALDHCGLSGSEFQGVLVYTSGILSNLGNYNDSGIKFIPNIPENRLKCLIEKSDAFAADAKLMRFLWAMCGNQMFLLNEKNKQLGFADNGVTTYFSSNCTQHDATVVNEFLQSEDLDVQNTRVFKDPDRPHYEIRVASVLNDGDDEDEEWENLTGTYDYKGHTFKVTRGDYGPILGLVNKCLEDAKKYTTNENEMKMLENYIDSFKTGSPEPYQEGTTLWLREKSPVIETCIGFGDTYRDPAGQRGEFEGFVAMVNKEMSVKFSKLVESAKRILPLLPWPKTFEEDHFADPDFTSLDVLTFAATNRIPVGLNIWAYDESSKNNNYKNFYLGNVMSGTSDKEIQWLFLSDEDRKLMNRYARDCTELDVGLHEMFGHGTGKLFKRYADGKFNFDVKAVINPLTGRKIKSWYEPGESYDSKFLSLGPSYEECRAMSVALLLSLSKVVLQICGYEGIEAEELSYTCWLYALFDGLCGLDTYQPEGRIWTNAHLQASFVILRVRWKRRKSLSQFMKKKEVMADQICCLTWIVIGLDP